MILILASEFDEAAQDLAASWPNQAAALLTPKDAASPGWRIAFGDEGRAQVVAGGRLLEASEVDGVITRLPGIVPRELYEIAPEDRSYVATEINALLVHWLSAISCPVLNRPSPMCLAGPAFRHEQWMLLAAECEIPVQTHTRSTAEPRVEWPAGELSRVVVIGERVLGDVNAVLRTKARALARAAGVELVEIRFVTTEGREYFHGANLLPNLASADVRSALYERFPHSRA